MAERHEFALYWKDVSVHYAKLNVDSVFSVEDEALFHRAMRVLRLRSGDQLILFDQKHHIRCVFHGLSGKKTLEFQTIEKKINPVLNPHIKVLVPLLKKDALEQAIYDSVELGANSIQLITTQKVHRTWGGAREGERLRVLSIAAAEQSKNFSFPSIHEPISLEDALKESDQYDARYFFHLSGESIQALCSSAGKGSISSCTMLIGPEGDLTQEERALVKNFNFSVYRLTPTVLRAQQAIALSLGILRAMMY